MDITNNHIMFKNLRQLILRIIIFIFLLKREIENKNPAGLEPAILTSTP